MFFRELLQINHCIIVANGWKQLSLISVATFCLKRICNENPAETERNISTFVKQRLCNGRYYNGTETVHLQRNGTETVHFQQNDIPQRIETSCETFREKRFEDYFAMVSSGRNYVFVSGNF
jgi:hypothetical protein